MGKAKPKLVNEQLAAAMSHPTRAQAMAVLSEREASPKEIAAELDEPINNVTYHVDQLVKLDCIELVRTAPVKGGRVVEHFYRASRRTWVDNDEWESLGPVERQVLSTTLLRSISNDLNDAIASGTFFDPDDNHLSRTTFVLDHSGWTEVEDLLKATLMELLDIRARVAGRVAANHDQETIPTKVEIMHFRSPAKRGEA